MLNMDLDTSINSIPYLNYMEQQENKSNDKESGNDNTYNAWNQNARPNTQFDD